MIVGHVVDFHSPDFTYVVVPTFNVAFVVILSCLLLFVVPFVVVPDCVVRVVTFVAVLLCYVYVAVCCPDLFPFDFVRCCLLMTLFTFPRCSFVAYTVP